MVRGIPIQDKSFHFGPTLAMNDSSSFLKLYSLEVPTTSLLFHYFSPLTKANRVFLYIRYISELHYIPFVTLLHCPISPSLHTVHQ